MKKLLLISLSLFFLSWCSWTASKPLDYVNLPINTTGDITSDIIYVDNQIGFQFTYPKVCKITKNIENDFTGGIKYTDCVIEIMVMDSSDTGMSLESYLKQQITSDEISEDNIKALLKITNVDSIETIRLSSFLFTKIDNSGVFLTEDLDGNWQYVFKKGKYIVFLTPHMRNADESPDTKTFDQIVSSMKFWG